MLFCRNVVAFSITLSSEVELKLWSLTSCLTVYFGVFVLLKYSTKCIELSKQPSAKFSAEVDALQKVFYNYGQKSQKSFVKSSK